MIFLRIWVSCVQRRIVSPTRKCADLVYVFFKLFLWNYTVELDGTYFIHHIMRYSYSPLGTCREGKRRSETLRLAEDKHSSSCLSQPSTRFRSPSERHRTHPAEGPRAHAVYDAVGSNATYSWKASQFIPADYHCSLPAVYVSRSVDRRFSLEAASVFQRSCRNTN